MLLIGTAIYLGRPTSRYFELLERLHFCSLSYDDYSNYFKGKVSVGLFVSMNAKVILYPCYDTLQVSDYSKFNMASFDESKKKLSHEKNFPKDLENAYQIGQELSKRRL